MEEAIRRILLSEFPELKNNYHLPMLGRVERIANPPRQGGTSTHDEPLHAVDIQPLDHHFKPKGELLRDIAVAVPYAGQHRGFYALPDPGCIIEFCFSYALPHLIHIRGTIPWGLALPAVDEGEAKWQHSEQCYQGYNKEGDWHQIGRVHQSVAAIKQLMKAPKTWIGSDGENVLQIILDFMDQVTSALDTLANHTHPNVDKITQGGSVEGNSSAIKGVKGRLDPITEK